MKSLPIYISERLSTNKDEILLTPMSKDELINVILDRFNNGIGDLNDIDVSELEKEDFYRLFYTLRDDIKKNNITKIDISNWKLKELYCFNDIGMFEDCETLKTIILPDCLGVIGDFTFCNCKKLNNIIIPESVKNIDCEAFEDCVSLTRITIPNLVNYIGIGAFRRCSNLKSVSIADSVVSIGGGAFFGCPDLTITVPNRRVKELVEDSGFNSSIIIK